MNPTRQSRPFMSLVAACGGAAIAIAILIVLSGELVDGGSTGSVRSGLSELGALAVLLLVASVGYERFRALRWAPLMALLAAIATAIATLVVSVGLLILGLQIASS